VKMLAGCALAVLWMCGCSASQQRSLQQGAGNAAIVTAVAAKLTAVDVDATTAVHVAAHDGVVTLTGEAKNAGEKVRYDAAARSVSGVRSVVDRLRINPHVQGAAEKLTDAELATKVQATIFAQAGINGFHVAAHAHAGVVTLTGTAPSPSVKQTIIASASKVNGVRHVIDDVRIAR